MAIILFRSILLFLSLFLLMRLMGKRQMGQLEPSELVVSVLIADLGAHPLQDTGLPMLYGLTAILTVFCMEMILSGMALRWPRLRSLLWGRPCFLIENGVIRQKEMRRNRLTPEELSAELRRQSVRDIRAVEYAVLETDGTLNVLLSPGQQPVTAGQLGLENQSSGYSYILVDEGRILEENLRRSGHDRGWLQNQLRLLDTAPENIYLLVVNGAGELYLAAKETP